MNLRCTLWYHITQIVTNESGNFVMDCTQCGTRLKAIQVKKSTVMHAPIATVYALTTDYTKWHSFLPYVQSASLISEKENENVIEGVITNIKGKTQVWKMVQRIVCPNRIEEEQPYARKNVILRTVQTFQDIDGETQYTVTRCLQFQYINFLYPLIIFVFGNRLEKALQIGLEKFIELKKRAAENTQISTNRFVTGP